MFSQGSLSCISCNVLSEILGGFLGGICFNISKKRRKECVVLGFFHVCCWFGFLVGVVVCGIVYGWFFMFFMFLCYLFCVSGVIL